MKKQLLSSLLVLIILINIVIPISADLKIETNMFSELAITSITGEYKDYSTDLSIKKGYSPLVKQSSEVLDSLQNTRTIVIEEKDIIKKMLEDNTISREYLNKKMEILSHSSIQDLLKKGYNFQQIRQIKNYSIEQDAYEYLYSNITNYKKDQPKVTFRYGLAGSNTKKDITIAYDIKWSSCPLFTFTDNFGIGWIAADSNSYELVTKTNSTMAQINYYDPKTEKHSGTYRNVSMNKSTNGVVIGSPIMGNAEGNYGKHMGGITKISTQSNSYNIDTIHVFVTYAHTGIAIGLDWGIGLDWEKVSGIISFTAKPRQTVIAEGDYIFNYNSQGDVEADQK